MNYTKIPPLKFIPILKQAPWGGERIIPFKHLDSQLDHVGESWEISDVHSDISIATTPPYEGQRLTDLVSRFGARLVGEKVYREHGASFPLLVKFIDAKQDLSIQVHPDDNLARQRGGLNGKTEMWYIVDAAPQASLLCGWNRHVEKSEYRQCSADGTICNLICRHDVHPGDSFFIPAGQVHAICKDIFLIEIQQSSDITYRLYDYGRMGLDGCPRQLHIEEAEDAIDFSPAVPRMEQHGNTQANVPRTLADCDYFTTRDYQITQVTELPAASMSSFILLIAYEGTFTLTTDTTPDTTSVTAGQTVLIAAETEKATVIPSTEGCKFLCVTIR